MGRHAMPLAYIKASGAAVKNPQDYRGQIEADSPPLGEPCDDLPPSQVAEWWRFQNELPWLKECHRALVEIACQVRADARRGLAKAADLRLLLSILSALGATPATEGRVIKGKEPEEDDEFN